MVSIRNPIDRIVSWFQYMHPNNCVPNRPSGACNLKKDNNPWGINFYHKCFPDINDFVRSMGDDSIVKESTDCSVLASETVQGKGPEGKKNHRPASPIANFAYIRFRSRHSPSRLDFLC
jgi:hypothetical protein